MNTLKTGVVIVLLLGVSYGVYQIINAPDPSMIGEEEPLVEFDQEGLQEVSPTDFVGGGSSYALDKQPLQNPPLSGDGAFVAPDLVPNPSVRSGSDTNPAQQSPGSNAPQSNPYAQMGNNYANQAVTNDSINSYDGGFADNDSMNQMGQPSNGNRLVPIPAKEDQTQRDFNALENPNNVIPVSHENTEASPGMPLAQKLAEIESQVSQGRLRSALEQLTPYHSQSLTPSERQILYQWLDYLAFKVIYSPEHHLFQQPHVIANTDSLYSLATAWNVPPELIYNINRGQITSPDNLIPGTSLKKVRGPFRAEINLSTNEMTVFLHNMYAGRFPITIGGDAQLQPGLLRVQAKSNQGAEYRGSDGQVHRANDPQNPYGRYWLDLGSNICIHEKPQSIPAYDRRGCIQVDSMHANDVYGILSKDSSIRITR